MVAASVVAAGLLGWTWRENRRFQAELLTLRKTMGEVDASGALKSAVSDINLAVQPPAVVLMAGLQGAGKTAMTLCSRFGKGSAGLSTRSTWNGG